MTAAQQDNPYLTITLTGHAPVKIKKDDWPVLATGEDSWHDGQIERQANRKIRWAIKVREHKDGRALVYGIYSFSSNWQNEENWHVRGGELLVSGADKIEAIQRVGRWMAEAIPSERDQDRERFLLLTEECIADLPAEEI